MKPKKIIVVGSTKEDRLKECERLRLKFESRGWIFDSYEDKGKKESYIVFLLTKEQFLTHRKKVLKGWIITVVIIFF